MITAISIRYPSIRQYQLVDGAIRAASEQTSSGPVAFSAAKAADSAATPIEAGTTEIDAQVSVTFDLH